ncbi:class I SAM-dependent methyltransferase [Chloroflexota bacterium]
MNEDRAVDLPPSDGDRRWGSFAWFHYPFMKLSFIPFGGEGMFRRKTIAFANPGEGEGVLDACCGTASLTALIAEKVGKTGKVTGIDISEKALEKAAQKLKDGFPLTLRQASCTSLPFQNDSFDSVFISFGMHEMSADDRLKSLNEVKRVLKDDGSFFIVEYNLPHFFPARFAVKAFNKIFESQAAYRMLTDGTLLENLKQAGFVIKRQRTLRAGMFQILHTVRVAAEGKNDTKKPEVDAETGV